MSELGNEWAFWNVGGVPVAFIPTQEGVSKIRAFDVSGGRPVQRSWAQAEGFEISAQAFGHLRKSFAASPSSQPPAQYAPNPDSFAQRYVDNLNMNVLGGVLTS